MDTLGIRPAGLKLPAGVRHEETWWVGGHFILLKYFLTGYYRRLIKLFEGENLNLSYTLDLHLMDICL